MVGAVVIHASEEAAAVVFLFLIGELLDGVAAGKARAGIQSFTKLVPKITRSKRAARRAKCLLKPWRSAR